MEPRPPEAHAEWQWAGHDHFVLWGLRYERSQPLPCATVRALSLSPPVCHCVLWGLQPMGRVVFLVSFVHAASLRSPRGSTFYSLRPLLSTQAPLVGASLVISPASWTTLRRFVWIYKYFQPPHCLLYWNSVFTRCPHIGRIMKTYLSVIMNSLEVTYSFHLCERFRRAVLAPFHLCLALSLWMWALYNTTEWGRWLTWLHSLRANKAACVHRSA